ncbi:MAG: sulfatase [Phycisphaerae bacterium]|nr:sulfatase [Phycisphaerae bacterium]
MAKRVRKHSHPIKKPKRAEADTEDSKHGARLVLWVVLAVVLISGGWGVYRKLSSSEPDRPTPTGPNVLLISIDMLRPDHLHCYGYHRETSPRLDRLAAEGVLFENHISSTSWTLPAHAALFTSLADSVHGCQDTDRRLPDKLVTLAEEFAAAGYKTAGFFSGPYLHPAFGLSQGFEHYEDCTSYARKMADKPAEEWAHDPDVMRSSHRDVTNPIIFPAVKKWLSEHGESKFFMFIHMWDPHFDFIPPPPYDTMFDPDYTGTITGEDFFINRQINKYMPPRDLEHLLALYDGEIAWTDLYVRQIIAELEQAGLLEDTVVAITSDHGTEFFEHGLKGHRQTLFDESIRVPLIIRYPAELPAGVRVTAQTRIIDIGPTLLELAGVTTDTLVMGHSLVPSALGEPLDFENTAISELFWGHGKIEHRMRSIRTLKWKYVDDQVRNRRFYLNLADDPGEQTAWWDLTQGVGRKLHDRYTKIVATLEDWRIQIAAGAARSTLSAHMRKVLESFGYVGEEEAEMQDFIAEEPTSLPSSTLPASSLSDLGFENTVGARPCGSAPQGPDTEERHRKPQNG